MPHSSVVSIIVNKDLATGQEHCLATGYNHTPDGSCCEVNGKTKDSVIHAEVAAITSLNKKLVANLQVVNPTVIDNKNLTMFVTHTPCIDCSIAIKKAGIETIIVVERFLISITVGLTTCRLATNFLFKEVIAATSACITLSLVLPFTSQQEPSGV